MTCQVRAGQRETALAELNRALAELEEQGAIRRDGRALECNIDRLNDIAAALRLRQPQVSKHLSVLREVGLVDVRGEGRQSQAVGALVRQMNHEALLDHGVDQVVRR